ncbi:hypothetical protein Z948_3573 [Sulfitobacter donghicola DSW-25 = KCTC 12864 = JCM 14565]|nr:hypothetical protein Z948_3573 [Sulfitobacter donghicola DSW-25 = KCTC 12864 = JCM 14565]
MVWAATCKIAATFISKTFNNLTYFDRGLWKRKTGQGP